MMNSQGSKWVVRQNWSMRMHVTWCHELLAKGYTHRVSASFMKLLNIPFPVALRVLTGQTKVRS